MMTAMEGCRASCAWRRGGAKATPSRRALIQRFAPPSPACGRRGLRGASGGVAGGAVAAQAMPSKRALIRRFAPPSPACGRRSLRGANGGVVRRSLRRCAGYAKQTRPHPARCATFSRTREKDLPGPSGVGVRSPLGQSCSGSDHSLLPLAGEGARRADGGEACVACAQPPAIPISYAATPDTPADAHWRPSAAVHCGRFRARA